MPTCAVMGCKNNNRLTKNSGIRYYRFPKDRKIYNEWIIACRPAKRINLKHACVCSVHFASNCFVELSFKQRFLNYTPKNYRNLKSDAVPTLKIAVKSENDNSPERSIHLSKTGKTEVSTNTINTLNNNNYEQGISDTPVEISNDTDLHITNINKNLELEEKLLSLEKENVILKENLEKSKRKIEQMEAILGKMFTPAQMKKMLNSETKITFWQFCKLQHEKKIR